jgi:acetylglutamate kinase
MNIVLKVGGNVILDESQVAALASEIRVLLSRGCRVTVVHGGGPQLDAALTALGGTVEKVDGLRVTSPAAANVVQETLDAIGWSLCAALRDADVPATHVPSASHLFRATVKDARLGRVGTVSSCRAAPLRGVAVITPVGFDPIGPLNLNADEGAAAVAKSLKADWLVLATDVAAVRDGHGNDLERLTRASAQALIGGAAKGGMIPKLQNALDALAGGVRHVLIARISPGALVAAILDGRPHGTLVEDSAQVPA